MSPSRPYLVHAFYDWILANGKTPFLMVDTTIAGVDVPHAYITDDEIVLNIWPDSVTHFAMSHQSIEFNARFSGKLKHIFVPMQAVKALYTKEDMIGVGFSPEGMPYFVGDVAGSTENLPEEVAPSMPAKADLSDNKKTKRDGPSYLTLVD
jgi:stringent starvation protein B